MAKPALGKGLGALINTRVSAPVPAEADGERIQSILLADIIPSPLQPRSEFRPDQLNELVESIRELGVIQPLVEGLGEELLVETDPPAGVNDHPMSYDDAVRAAL